MHRATLMLAAALCAAPAHAGHASHPYGHHASPYTVATPQGPGLRTVPTTATQWAAVPLPHALGTYRSAPPAPHGTSPLRAQHVQALRTCNPFAGVQAAAPLPLCR